MKFKFWGVRGSIPTPGPATIKYGGNTTCIEIRTDNNDLIILDAGTGIQSLAQGLLGQLPISAHILLTHTHWDHIQGLPFFTPIFIPGNQLKIYGGQDPVTGIGIERALTVQLQYSYFPIREAELKANVEYVTVKPGQAIEVGTAKVTPVLLNHPVLNFGYRIDCDGRSVFFTGDYEPPYNIYNPEDEEYADYQTIVNDKLTEVAGAMENIDALIIDSSYTDEEYLTKKGWGHGTYDFAINLARETNAGSLYFTHHEPTRSDAELDMLFKELILLNTHGAVDLYLAREGMEIEL